MARPRSTAVADWLESLGDARCERLIFDRFAEGVTTRKIVVELQEYADLTGAVVEVLRTGLYMWQKRTPERQAAWIESLKVGAEANVEEEGKMYDDLHKRTQTHFVTREEVKVTEMRGKQRRWLASVTDRERYGEQQIDPTVNQLNVGQLHLTAIREVNQVFSSVFARKLPPRAVEVEAEVIDEARPIDKLFQRATAKPKRSLDDVLGLKPKRTLEDVLG